jgi:hypothetical protein
MDAGHDSSFHFWNLGPACDNVIRSLNLGSGYLAGCVLSSRMALPAFFF